MTNDKQNLNVLAVVLTYNEGEKLQKLISRFPDHRDYKLLFVDDGSTDKTTQFITNLGFTVIKHKENLGVGAGIRTAIEYCRENGWPVMVKCFPKKSPG